MEWEQPQQEQDLERIFWIRLIGILGLLFFVIPIRIEPDTTDSDLKLFEKYVADYNKSYRDLPTEYSARFVKFQKSLRNIEEMNRARKSPETALYGLTEFSDMSEDEFERSNLRTDMPIRNARHLHHGHNRNHNNNRIRRFARNEIPLKFDWRDKGFVTPVRSQNTCGACWAFSTVQVAETMFAIKNGTLYPLSVQQMIDCAGNGNFGCSGGDICSLLMWLETTKVNIQMESEYPLTWKTDDCRLAKSETNVGVRVAEFTCDNFVDDEESLMEIISVHGPVAAAVNALSWQNYLGGIIQYHCDGNFKSVNHAVQIVGYDRTGPVPFYIVRNSWGTNFGDKGYLYVAANGNLCGIANQVSALNVV